MCTWSGRVTQRCHNSPNGKQVLQCRWRHATEALGMISGILKKSVSRVENWTPNDFRGSQRPNEFARYGRCTRWAADDKARIEIMYIFLLESEEHLNSKVIRGFVPELRSRYVFFEFRDSYVLCDICIYVMNIPCTFLIFMHMAMLQS